MTDFILTFVLWSAVIFGVKTCAESDWVRMRVLAAQARNAEVTAQRLPTIPPHVISEADGCKVYTFTPGGTSRESYFTRCAEGTTTTSSYATSCGKGCSKSKTETIEVRK